MIIDHVEQVVKLAVNYGLPLILIIYYLLIELPRMRNHQKEILDGLKKELNIDDLIITINELSHRLEESTTSNNNIISSMNESVGLINVDIHNLKKDITKSFDNILQGMKETGEAVQQVFEAKKRFSDSEMYEMITNRFQLSITNIVDEFIEIIDANNLFITKDLLFAEIKDKIRVKISEGRNFIYSCNFDKRLLDVIFQNTDNSIDLADTLVKNAFNKFYAKGEANINDNDYTLLKREIRSIGSSIRNESDKMLKKILLRVDRG